MNRLNTIRSQAGLSLVELMIALLISTLILAGLVQIFSMNRSTYQSDEGLARLQENARFAMEFLTREIRNVGNMGCFPIPKDNADKDNKISNYIAGTQISGFGTPIPEIYDTTKPLRGHDAAAVNDGMTYILPQLYPPAVTAGTTPALPGTINPTGIVVGSDVLVVRGMDQDSFRLGTPTNDPNQVFVTTPHNLIVGQVVVASDCERAAVFQVTSINNGVGGDGLMHDVGGSPGNTCNVWGTPSCRGKALSPDGSSFDKGAEVAAFRNMVYYIGAGTGGGPSLFRDNYINGTRVSEELVEGIENLQFHYGDGTRYFEGRNVTDWTAIRSVRIGMLVATSNVVTGQDTNPANTQGATEASEDTSQHLMSNITLIPPNDRRRRRVFETTVVVRNPL